MDTFINWIKEQFSFFSRIGDELRVLINDTEKPLPPQIKQNLIASIKLGPAQFIDEVKDENNNIPEELREELLQSVMRASQLYVQPIPQMVSIKTNWKVCFDEVLKELVNKCCMRECQRLLHKEAEVVAVQIPNPFGNVDWKVKFSAVLNQIIYTYCVREYQREKPLLTACRHPVIFGKREPVWKHIFDRVLKQLLVHHFLKVQYINKVLHDDAVEVEYDPTFYRMPSLIPSGQYRRTKQWIYHKIRWVDWPQTRCDPHRTMARVLKQMMFRIFLKIQRREVSTHKLCQLIASDPNSYRLPSLIRSGQFKTPYSPPIYRPWEPLPPGLIDMDRMWARVFEHEKLKDFIQARRLELKQKKIDDVSDTRVPSLIPSGQFCPPRCPVRHHPIWIRDPPRDLNRVVKRLQAQLGLRMFIAKKRQELLSLSPEETVETSHIWERDGMNWIFVYNKVMEHLKIKHWITVQKWNYHEHIRSLMAQMDPDHRSQWMIPSGQYKRTTQWIYPKVQWVDPPKPRCDPHRTMQRVRKQLVFRHYLKLERDMARQQKANQKSIDNMWSSIECIGYKLMYDNVMFQLTSRYQLTQDIKAIEEHFACLRAQDDPTQVIYTSKIIPSDQFVPRDSTEHHPRRIYVQPAPIDPYQSDWCQNEINNIRIHMAISKLRKCMGYPSMQDCDTINGVVC